MAGNPLVSVITPTWCRPKAVQRAIQSVRDQSYKPAEHIVISDGPGGAEFKALIDANPDVRFAELEDHDPRWRWGHRCRMLGIGMARGSILAWLDDDNAWRPAHLDLVVGRLLETGAGFAYSTSMFNRPGNDYPVGAEPPQYSHIDTSSIVNRKEILEIATWRDEGQETIEWDLVERWMGAGIGWAYVPVVTVDNYLDRE